MKISTKTGDKAQTSLVFGRRVSKASQRVKAYGAVDALSAHIALARAFAGQKPISEFLLNIQQKLVFLMTELATDNADYHLLAEKKVPLLGGDDLAEIERRIDEIESRGDGFTGWKHPGETPLEAALDLARASCHISFLDARAPLRARAFFLLIMERERQNSSSPLKKII